MKVQSKLTYAAQMSNTEFRQQIAPNDLQTEQLAEIILHIFSNINSRKSICSWTNNEQRKRGNISNKYETANYSLSSAGNNQFLW